MPFRTAFQRRGRREAFEGSWHLLGGLLRSLRIWGMLAELFGMQCSVSEGRTTRSSNALSFHLPSLKPTELCGVPGGVTYS
jgi:hypothetical protein